MARPRHHVSSASKPASRPQRPTPTPPGIYVGPPDKGSATSVLFQHTNSAIGSLLIETGIDTAKWGYNLNTQTYATYGGEVVQILSVYIDDLTIGGTISTYSQMEAIYSYFAAYMQIATQGKTPVPAPGDSAYNLDPIKFTYPHRGWEFDLYPKSAPGFHYGNDVVAPVWQMTAHIIDDSVDLNPIKDQIKNTVIQGAMGDFTRLNNAISPDAVNPEANPFQAADPNAQKVAKTLSNLGDYYNSLIAAYNSGDFTAIGGGVGSQPASSTPSTPTSPGGSPGSPGGTVQPPSTLKNPKPGGINYISGPPAPNPLTGSGEPADHHSQAWHDWFNTNFDQEWSLLLLNPNYQQPPASNKGAAAAYQAFFTQGGPGYQAPH